MAIDIAAIKAKALALVEQYDKDIERPQQQLDKAVQAALKTIPAESMVIPVVKSPGKPSK
jgi:hypothetical protein